jgi:hypothetical protein
LGWNTDASFAALKLIGPNLVLQLGQGPLNGLTTDNPLVIVGIEDIIPFNMALHAGQSFATNASSQM